MRTLNQVYTEITAVYTKHEELTELIHTMIEPDYVLLDSVSNLENQIIKLNDEYEFINWSKNNVSH